MNTIRNLTGFQRDLLRAIAHNDGSRGLLLKDKLQEMYGTEINHGRLYPNLDDLVEYGLIEKGTIDDRTNSYSLTEDGRDTIRLFENRYADAGKAMNMASARAD